MCISFPPYFDHDAFMHHPMHVLDAPVLTCYTLINTFHLSFFQLVLVFLCLSIRSPSSRYSNSFQWFSLSYLSLLSSLSWSSVNLVSPSSVHLFFNITLHNIIFSCIQTRKLGTEINGKTLSQ